MGPELLQRYARLIVEVGANVQPGQVVWISCEPGAAPLVRELAAQAYARGARFVDPWYFDPYVKRSRLELAAVETLDYVPDWYGRRLLALGEGHGVRISITPQVPPGLLAGIDPERAGIDGLPAVKENFEVINRRTTNWCVVPWATADWAATVHPHLEPAQALARLEEQLVYVLRLDEDDPAAAWLARATELHGIAKRLDALQLDSLHFTGPGTDLNVGLLPTSHFAKEGPRSRTVDGVEHAPNLPSEEVWTTPDPLRVDGTVRSTKPLDVHGAVVRGLRIRFQEGRAVEIEADENADALRGRCSLDEGASRLGEVALVDRAGRVGRTDTIFFNTLLDENAASHLAFGNAYQTTVGEADIPRINRSAIHLDFMIGSSEVSVSGHTRDGAEVPLLVAGDWQI